METDRYAFKFSGAARKQNDAFLLSSKDTHPKHSACLLDGNGQRLAYWSCDAEQISENDPAVWRYRGWNHVHATSNGGLLAITPLQSIMLLDRDSRVVWSVPCAAHHEIVRHKGRGSYLTLVEKLRHVSRWGYQFFILDSIVSEFDQNGSIVERFSALDLLFRAGGASELLRQKIEDNLPEFEAVQRTMRDELTERLETGQIDCLTLARCRSIGGELIDLLHCNGIGLSPSENRLAISSRTLNCILVTGLDGENCLSYLNTGLDGQHNPSFVTENRLLVFDNGVTQGRSRILEYDWTTPSEYTVLFEGNADFEFSCRAAGGCQRIEDDCILIANSEKGMFFSVDDRANLLWECQVADAHDSNRKKLSFYRVERYSRSEIEL